MKNMLKIAFMCVAMAGYVMATSCGPEGTETKPEFAVNFTAENTGGKVEVTVGGTTVASGDSFVEGTDVIIKAVPETGYTFEGWSGVTLGDNKALEAAFKMPAQAVTLAALFEEVVIPETYALNFNAAQRGGTIEVKVDGQAVESGVLLEADTEVSIKAAPAAGYTFAGWSGVETEDGTALETTFVMPAGEVTLSAAFNANSYKITISPEIENGSVELRVNGGEPITSGGEFPVGSEVFVKATAGDGYLFSGWRVSNDDNGESVAIGEAATATFTMPAYAITIIADFVIDASNTWVKIAGMKWAKYNVGAPGEFVENPYDYGMLYQFGKTVGWYGPTPIPADGEFYITAGENGGWGSGASANNSTYGQGPCPANYTLPTEAQYKALIEACTQSTEPLNGVNGVTLTAGDASLFFPYAGYEGSGQRPTTTPTTAGTYGYYWMNDVVSWNGRPGPPPMARMVNVSSSFTMMSLNRAGILSIRCVMVE
jgi:uncharacterized repeat protein (TIGR02543 family)